MKSKNTQEFGEVQQSVSIRLEYSIHTFSGGVETEAKVVKSIDMDVGRYSSGRGLSIGNIVAFQKGANELLQLAKNLLMNGTYVQFSLTKSAYEHVPEYTMHDELGAHKLNLKTLEFMAWTFEDSTLDCDPNEEGAGLYLRPDTKNSDAEETHDGILYWKKDILESLAEMHL